jgi:endo-alpha-1,4-polygalactosaminidase (GH114 family)
MTQPTQPGADQISANLKREAQEQRDAARIISTRITNMQAEQRAALENAAQLEQMASDVLKLKPVPPVIVQSAGNPLARARSWLRVLRYDAFPRTRAQFVQAIAEHPCDVVVLGANGPDGQPWTKAEIAAMKVKPDGSRRIVLIYLDVTRSEMHYLGNRFGDVSSAVMYDGWLNIEAQIVRSWLQRFRDWIASIDADGSYDDDKAPVYNASKPGRPRDPRDLETHLWYANHAIWWRAETLKAKPDWLILANIGCIAAATDVCQTFDPSAWRYENPSAPGVKGRTGMLAACGEPVFSLEGVMYHGDPNWGDDQRSANPGRWEFYSRLGPAFVRAGWAVYDINYQPDPTKLREAWQWDRANGLIPCADQGSGAGLNNKYE